MASRLVNGVHPLTLVQSLAGKNIPYLTTETRHVMSGSTVLSGEGGEGVSSVIARQMERLYGDSAKVVKIEMLHEEEINKYITKVEQAHTEATKSALVFCWLGGGKE